MPLHIQASGQHKDLHKGERKEAEETETNACAITFLQKRTETSKNGELWQLSSNP